MASEFTAAAVRCRKAVPENPGATGVTLARLASHYAGMARDWFARADALPARGVMQ